MNSISDKISLTNEQIGEAFAKVGANLEIDYGDDENIAVTSDTLDDFRSARLGYSERGNLVEFESGLVIEGAQVRKGQPREFVYVVDFGAVRAVYRG